MCADTFFCGPTTFVRFHHKVLICFQRYSQHETVLENNDIDRHLPTNWCRAYALSTNKTCVETIKNKKGRRKDNYYIIRQQIDLLAIVSSNSFLRLLAIKCKIRIHTSYLFIVVVYIYIYISRNLICATNQTSLNFFISSWKNVWKWQSKMKEEYGSCISQANKVIDEVDLWWYEMKLEIHTLTISVNEHHHFNMMKVLPGVLNKFCSKFGLEIFA